MITLLIPNCNTAKPSSRWLLGAVLITTALLAVSRAPLVSAEDALLEDNKDLYQFELALFLQPYAPRDQFFSKPPLPLTSGEHWHLVDYPIMTANQSVRLATRKAMLQPTLDSLNRSRDYRVLDFMVWQRTLTEQDPPFYFEILSNISDNPVQFVEGRIQLRRGRYLHAAGDLTLYEAYWHFPLSLDNWLAAPDSLARSFSDALGSPVTGDSDLKDLATIRKQLLAYPKAQLRESRRMRGGEQHFLDGETLGILVRVDSVEPEAELSDSQ